MRLAESHGVGRDDFLKNYLGSELDPLWLNRVSKLGAKGWKNFVARDKDRIKELRAQIYTCDRDRSQIGEFRNVSMVSRSRPGTVYLGPVSAGEYGRREKRSSGEWLVFQHRVCSASAFVA